MYINFHFYITFSAPLVNMDTSVLKAVKKAWEINSQILKNLFPYSISECQSKIMNLFLMIYTHTYTHKHVRTWLYNVSQNCLNLSTAKHQLTVINPNPSERWVSWSRIILMSTIWNAHKDTMKYNAHIELLLKTTFYICSTSSTS